MDKYVQNVLLCHHFCSIGEIKKILLFNCRNRPKEHIRIVVGNLHNQEMDEHEQQFNVEAIISHKSYSRE